jgi:catechol 2,3-dioxygenase-like lactoylglutathione lyase family enzyme
MWVVTLAVLAPVLAISGGLDRWFDGQANAKDDGSLDEALFRFVESGLMLSDHPVFPILLSTDLDATRTFYHDTLGLEILREDEGDRIVFRCGAGTQLVVTLSTVGTSDPQTQMAWRVPDLQAALVDLRSRGVRIEEYTAPDPVTTEGIADMGHSWAAWIVDPSRNVLALVQPKP